LTIAAPAVAGWEGVAAVIAHLRFVRDHRRKVDRVAVASDRGFIEQR
jgi:hypothetical protein